jgi:hypothetical protein
MVAHPVRVRSARYAAQSDQKEIERNFLAGDFVWDFFAASRVHRNIRVERTQEERTQEM